ncbi:MAG: hypothetical protein ACO1SV_19460 [Fimbriimonas sp.]
MNRMVTAVVILVAAAAFQGVYNLLKEARSDFDLVDPAEKLEHTPFGVEEVEPPQEQRRAA